MQDGDVGLLLRDALLLILKLGGPPLAVGDGWSGWWCRCCRR